MKTHKKMFYFIKYVATSPTKLTNFFMIETSKKLKRVNAWGYPHTMMIEPANYCNLQCPMCPTGKGQLGREKQKLEFDNFKKLIDEMGKYVVHLRMFGWGEPLIHQDLFKMIRYAKDKKMFVNIHTNAFFLNQENVKKMVESKMDELNISLDGASQETYSKYRRNGDFKKTCENIKLIDQYKKEKNTKYPITNLQFIVMKHNEHEIDQVKKLAENLGVNRLVLKVVGVDTKEEAEQYLPSQESLRGYEIEDDRLVSKVSNEGSACKMLWTEATVWVDGSVVPCCYDYMNKYSFGNAFKDGFKTIWKGQKIRNFRKQFLEDKNKIPICKMCTKTNTGSETIIRDTRIKK